MGVAGHLTIPVEIEDWLDSDNVVIVFIPSFNYRPGGSAQYGMAISSFDGEKPKDSISVCCKVTIIEGR